MNQRSISAAGQRTHGVFADAAVRATRLMVTLVLLLAAGWSGTASAQTARIHHKVIKDTNAIGPSLGRDLWFTLAQNYDAGGGNGKYYMLYVTSPVATTVKIGLAANAATAFPIGAGKVVAFNIPLGWESTTSGEVENKGVHIWSDDADLTAYVMSRNPATSDGFYVIPTIGWGKEYVVAGYHSLYELSFDYPSEFAVVANQNNTSTHITPTQDIRKTRQPNAVLHPKGAAFDEQMNRGQSVQYQLTQAQNADEWDVTGTLLSSNNPVGVVGASQCPNIPPSNTYCDHICDMIPPIRTWAATYYSAPFVNRKGGDSFCIIASKPGQTIYKDDKTAPGRTECVLNQYEPFFDPGIDVATKWYSDDAFFLAQYCNSTDWPTSGANNGIGDPAMVVINAVEQYTPKVIFQTPTILGGQATFQNFVNVIYPTDASQKTFFDGVTIGGAPGATQIQFPDKKYTISRISSVGQGTHRIVSDSGVGCYVYGYGSYDSYAWSGTLGIRTFRDPDHIAPTVDTIGECFHAHVDVKDIHINASKLSNVRLDSVTNMYFRPDLTFVPGSGVDSTFYDMYVADVTIPAYLSVTVTDIAGNRTTIQSTYIPQAATLTPLLRDYGSVANTATKCDSILITNVGGGDFNIKTLKLQRGNQGFTLGSNPDMSPLHKGESRWVQICFTPVKNTAARDTLLVGDECLLDTAALVGTGGDPDFEVSSYDFGSHVVNDKVFFIQKVNIRSLYSKGPIHVKFDKVDDPVHFIWDPAQAGNGGNGTPPVAGEWDVPPSGTVSIYMGFQATATGRIGTQGYFSSPDISVVNPGDNVRTDSLWGTGVVPSTTITGQAPVTLTCASVPPVVQQPFTDTIYSTGTVADTLKSITLSPTSDPGYQPLQLFDFNGTQIPLSSLPQPINPGEKWTVRTVYIPAPRSAGTFNADITIVTSTLTKTLASSETIIYRMADVDATSITGPVTAKYNSGPGPEQDFIVTNSQKDDLTITGLTLGGGDAAAFSLAHADVNGVPYAGNIAQNPLATPIVLKQGDVLKVYVGFNTAYSGEPRTFTSNITVSSDACEPVAQVKPLAEVTSVPGLVTGFNAGAVFACGSPTDNFANYTSTNSGTLDDQIAAGDITFSGLDATRFSYTGPAITVPAGKTVGIPITFSPLPSSVQTTYNAVVNVKATNANNMTGFTVSAPISAIAAGIETKVTSNPDKTHSAANGDVTLPINFESVDLSALPGMKLSDAQITSVHLVYTYRNDLFDVGDGKAPVTVSVPGWTLLSSSVGNGTLTLDLGTTGTAYLPDNFVGGGILGSVKFKVMLPGKSDPNEKIELTDYVLMTNGNSTQSACVVNKKASGVFTLDYLCGDKLLQDIMNGGKLPAEIITPATPNPAGSSSDDVTFSYAVRGAGDVTLSIYDVLGNEIARPVDHVKQAAGLYTVKYHIANLPNGTYTYRLQYYNSQQSKQLVIQR